VALGYASFIDIFVGANNIDVPSRESNPPFNKSTQLSAGVDVPVPPDLASTFFAQGVHSEHSLNGPVWQIDHRNICENPSNCVAAAASVIFPSS
jgi:hypothetical protein